MKYVIIILSVNCKKSLIVGGVMMETSKRKALRNKLIMYVIVAFAVVIAWQIFVLKLLEKGNIVTMTAIIMIAGSLVLIVGGVLFVVRYFLGKIIAIFTGIQDITSDAIDEKALKMVERNDEIGEMARTMQETFSSIKNIVEGIKKSSKELGEVSDSFQQIFQSMTSAVEMTGNEVSTIASNTITQAEQIGDMLVKIESIGNSIEMITQNIEMLAQSADVMKNYDESAKVIMNELVVISKKSSESMENVRQQTELTNQSAQEIRKATEIIAGISSQTNLLALNASIEAARAGEHGKGFAVVAEEIRALADQSRESTEQIEKIVSTLLDNSDVSVEITKEVSEAFLVQNDKIHETEVIFGSLNAEVDKVSGAIKEIEGEIEGLNSHKDIIEVGMSSLSESSKQNAESAEITNDNVEVFRKVTDECNSATETIVSVSDELLEYIKHFGIESI